jgi:hypothetical protein
MAHPPTALEGITDDVSTYFAGRLRHKLFNFPNDYPAKSMSEALVTHCERAIAVIAEAWINPPIVVSWEVNEYVQVIGKKPTGTYHLCNRQKKTLPSHHRYIFTSRISYFGQISTSIPGVYRRP